MAYNIPNANTALFSSTPDTANVQDWSFDVESPVNRFYFPGQAYPAPVAINLQVKDFPTIYQDTSIYSQILLHVDFISSEGSWTDPNPITDIAANGSDLANGLSYSYSLDFQNLEIITPPSGSNHFNGLIRFMVTGVLASNGGTQFLEAKAIYVNLYYVMGNFIQILPDEINFSHIKSDPLPPAKNIEVYCVTQFILSVEKTFDLVGYNNANAGDVGTAFWHQITPDATGITTLQVRPNIAIENTEDEVVNVDQALIAFSDFSFDFQDTTPISYFTSSDGNTSISPQTLNFLMIIGIDEFLSQFVSIISPYTSQITAPPWLTVSETEITNVGSFFVTPIDSSNLSPGIYTGQITITANGVDYFVDVSLEVVQQIQLNLSQVGFNFTDDNEGYTQIFSQNNLDQFQIDVTIPQIGYPNTFEDDLVFSYLTGFFNNRSKIHIGEIVRRSLYKMTKADFMSLFSQLLNTVFIPNFAFIYYTPPEVKLDLLVLDQNGVPSDIEESFSNITYVLGRPPKVVDGFAFLNFKPIVQRVFKNSVASINYLTANAIIFKIFKNESIFFSTNQYFLGLKVRCYMIDFDNYKIGDIIKVKASYLDAETEVYQDIDGIDQSYIIYPDGKHFNTIAYLDEYGCVRFYDFSGDWSIGSQYEYIQSSKYQKLVEFFRNETTDKTQSITINTGYIPQDNQYFIDLILRSGMAWLITNDSEKVVELVPQSKELVNIDSDNELYSYDVTFKINRKHDFQNYS